MEVAELDAIAEQFIKARQHHDLLKEKTSEAYSALQEVQARLLDAMESCGKPKYFVEGLGTFSSASRTSVKIESPQAFFDYIQKTYGDEVLKNMLTIHSAKVNSFYKEELEKGIADVPGLSQPISSNYIKVAGK